MLKGKRLRFLFCAIALFFVFALPANAARIPSVFPGDSGDAVIMIQKQLRDLSFYAYPEITGFYGEYTQAAVTAYQVANGLEADGVAGDQTLRSLFGDQAESFFSGYLTDDTLEAVLKMGMRGTSVEKLQRRLRELRYLPGDTRATGYFGTLTHAAVVQFQKAHDLDADGIVGPQTVAILYSDAAQKATEAQTLAVQNNEQPTSTPKSSVSLGTQVVALAKEHLGKKYVLGTAGPSTFDCSGLVMYVFDQVGISLPHSAQSIGYSSGARIDKSQLMPGDLVFFNTNASDGDLCDHVGIYIGGGQFIHASSGSSKKVVISDMSSSYYERTYSWARRVL